MMSALGGWLKEIIIILLLASFIDLVLPGRSMQRYVKVVVSLFILVTILSPIIMLLRADFSVDFDRLPEQLQNQGAKGGEMRALHDIMSDGRRLQEQNEARAFAMMQDRAAQLIREEIERRFPVEVTDISVDIGIDDEKEAKLRHIAVSVAAPQAREEAANGRKRTVEPVSVQPVRAVDPVTIDLWNDGDAAGQERRVRPDVETAEQEGEHNGLAQEISVWLASHWDIPPEHVRVIVAAGEKSGVEQESG